MLITATSFTCTSLSRYSVPSILHQDSTQSAPYKHWLLDTQLMNINIQHLLFCSSLISSHHALRSLQQVQMYHGSVTGGRCCICTGQTFRVHSPDGSTFLCEMTSWLPSWKSGINQCVLTCKFWCYLPPNVITIMATIFKVDINQRELA